MQLVRNVSTLASDTSHVDVFSSVSFVNNHVKRRHILMAIGFLRCLIHSAGIRKFNCLQIAMLGVNVVRTAVLIRTAPGQVLEKKMPVDRSPL